jgi:hypothetical protein
VAVLATRNAKKLGRLGDLDLLVANSQDASHVAPFKRPKGSSHDLDLLRRHRRNSTPQASRHTFASPMIAACP